MSCCRTTLALLPATGRCASSAEDGGDGLPPAPIRLASPYDTDTRWSAKRDLFWNGYKLHVSETCHPQADGDRPTRPNVITNVTTTDSTLPDVKALQPVHQALERRRLLPERHYLDSGYPSAELIVDSAKTYGIALITRSCSTPPARPRPKKASPPTTSPSTGNASRPSAPPGRPAPRGTPTSNRRQLSLYPRELTEAIRAARAQQQTDDWNRDYALRAGVEGTIRQATHTTGLRRARYRGLAKTHLDHTTSATALNLIRLHAWWNGHPLDRANHSHLARLQLSLAA
jgi:hypothetical protein